MLDIFEDAPLSLELFWADQALCWKCLGDDWVLEYFTENVTEW